MGNSRPTSILWVTQDQWRWDHQLPPSVTGVDNYVGNCGMFLEALDTEPVERMIVRYRPNKFGVKDRAMRQPQRAVLDALISAPDDALIYDLMNNAGLVVLDTAFTTTFLECISRNIPVIVFDSEAFEFVRPNIRDIYKALAETDVVHTRPERAAEVVNSIGDDIEAWWDDPARQQAVQSAAKVLALTGPSYFAKWRSFLLEIRGKRCEEPSVDTSGELFSASEEVEHDS